jgi:hypothetical protein
MKIQVIIPLWKRIEVTKVCFDHLKELIKSLPQHEFNVLCIVSEPEYMDMCMAYGFDYVAYKNDPLGEKINFGIKKALERSQWDYLMSMNSDSVINPKLFFDYYDRLFGFHDLFGVSRVTYVNFYTDEAVDFEYHFSLLGVARCISRKLVERFIDEWGCVYEPFRNRGLDDSVLTIARKMDVKPYFVGYEGQLVYDLKSDVNIHPWEKFAERGVKVTNELCCKAG